MPTAGPEPRRLARFVGNWSIAEVMHPSPWSPQETQATARSSYRMGCDGFFLICDYEQLRDGEVTFRGHGVYGWDARAGLYTMRWFDSMGHDPGEPATGKWTGNTLVFEHHTAERRARYTYTWLSLDRFAFRIENAAGDDGPWVPFLDSVYARCRG